MEDKQLYFLFHDIDMRKLGDKNTFVLFGNSRYDFSNTKLKEHEWNKVETYWPIFRR